MQDGEGEAFSAPPELLLLAFIHRLPVSRSTACKAPSWSYRTGIIRRQKKNEDEAEEGRARNLHVGFVR